MNALDAVCADVRAAIASARDHVALAKRRAAELPASCVEGVPWGERRQTVAASLERATLALIEAERALEP